MVVDKRASIFNENDNSDMKCFVIISVLLIHFLKDAAGTGRKIV